MVAVISVLLSISFIWRILCICMHSWLADAFLSFVDYIFFSFCMPFNLVPSTITRNRCLLNTYSNVCSLQNIYIKILLSAYCSHSAYFYFFEHYMPIIVVVEISFTKQHIRGTRIGTHEKSFKRILHRDSYIYQCLIIFRFSTYTFCVFSQVNV